MSVGRADVVEKFSSRGQSHIISGVEEAYPGVKVRLNAAEKGANRWSR